LYASAPTEVVGALRRCCCLFGLLAGGINTTNVERLGLPHSWGRDSQTYDKAKASERKPTFHGVTTRQ